MTESTVCATEVRFGPPQFTSKERDTESGLDYFGARYYESDLGRFMSPDWASKPTNVPYASFGNPQSLNLYAYVSSNPNTGIDADGHCGGVANTAANAQCGIAVEQSEVYGMAFDQYAASWDSWNTLLSSDGQNAIPGGFLSWVDMTTAGQAYVANSLNNAAPGQMSVWDSENAAGAEDQRIALAYRLMELGQQKGYPQTFLQIYYGLTAHETQGGNTDFIAPSDVMMLISGLGMTKGGQNPTGCELCRSGGLIDSPHFDGGFIHMDNFNGAWHIPVGTALHFFVDVFLGTTLYGNVPFSR